MSDSLLDDLRSGGARVSHGGFTIDRTKAREKLSKFQLVDPHHYVLEFVQAAYLLGATYVDFEIDSDSMRMVFDGEPFSRRELEVLYRASFSKADTPRLRALRHVAIGVSAAWALDPARFFITVDDATSRHRVMLRQNGEDEFEERSSLEEKKTTICLYESLKLSHLVEYFRYLRGELAETVALREYCAHADIPVLVNGDAASRGHKLHDRAQAVVEIDTPHETGRLGVTVDADIAASHIQVLTNGVLAKEIRGSEEPFGFDVILDSDRLRKGLSQSEIVRDEAWQHVRHAVIPEALYRSLAKLLRELDAVSAANHAFALRRAASWLWSLPDEQPTPEASASLKVARRALRRAPIWQYAHRSQTDSTGNSGTPLTSISEIDARFADGAVVTSSVSLSDAGSVPLPTAILVRPAHRQLFEQSFGARLRDITADIKQATARLERIDRLARRGKPRRPDPEYFQAHRVINDGSFEALLGIRVGDGRGERESVVIWNGQKLVLHRRDIELDLANLMIWIRGPLVFQMDSPHFRVSRAYVDVAGRILMDIPTLAAEVIDRVSPVAVVGWLRVLTDASAFRRLARDLEIPLQRIESLVDDVKTTSGATWHDFAQRPPPKNDAEITDRVNALGPFAEVAAIELGLERRVSLKELHDIYRRDGQLRLASKMFPQISGPLAITGGQREVDLVECVFGPLPEPDTLGDHGVFDALQSLPAPRPSAPTSVSDAPEPTADRAEPTRDDLEAERTPVPEAPSPKKPAARFLTSLERGLSTANAAWAARDVTLEERPGSPAAVMESSACVINEAHPVILAATEHPESNRHQRWALTAAWTALAAGGSRAEREFAFGQLADMLERA